MVIRRTDLASGTFYNYFVDKEAIFRAVVDESAQEIRGRLRTVRASARTLEAFVGDAYRVLFRFLVEDRLLFELLQRNAGPIRALFGESVLGAGVTDLFDDLRAAIDRGDLPPVDAEYLAGAMAGVALELGVRMVDRDPPDADVRCGCGDGRGGRRGDGGAGHWAERLRANGPVHGTRCDRRRNRNADPCLERVSDGDAAAGPWSRGVRSGDPPVPPA